MLVLAQVSSMKPGGKDQAALILFPLRPSPGDVGTILLAGVQVLFIG
jgi:hypothetical protein